MKRRFYLMLLVLVLILLALPTFAAKAVRRVFAARRLLPATG